MGRPQKIIAKWQAGRPRLVPVQEVLTVLQEYFPDQWKQNRTSHIVIRSKILKKYKRYQPYGEFSIPVSGGQKVKWYYVKDILMALDFLDHFEGQPDE